MATIKRVGNVCEITSIGTSDPDIYWYQMFDTPAHQHGLYVRIIAVDPAAASDIIIVREYTTDGPVICKCEMTDTYDARNFYAEGVFLRPVLKSSEQTLTAGGRVTIILANTL